MEDQKSSSSLKVIAVLAVLLVGSLIYIFKVTSEVKLQTELKSTMTDKELVMKDLRIKTTYDVAISETLQCPMS
jgi:hypothetical protein